MKRHVYGYQCPKCGVINYPYRFFCKGCKKTAYDEFVEVPLPTNGKLLTWTELYTPTGAYEVATLGLCIVELENGVRVTGQLELDRPKLGMKVKGEVKEIRKDPYETYHGFVFHK